MATVQLVSFLQHLPDFKGIETYLLLSNPYFVTCSTSLTSKGLRQNELSLFLIEHDLQHLPDFKGIETLPYVPLPPHLACSTSLTSKGSISESRPVNVYRPAFYILCQHYSRSNITLLVAVVRVNVLWPTGGIFPLSLTQMLNTEYIMIDWYFVRINHVMSS